MNDFSSTEYSAMPEAFKDLIDRIRYEDRRLKLILDHLDIGILTVDRGCHINFFNSMAENITGFRREDILGMPCSSIFGKVSKIRETVADGIARSDEHGEIITPDGRKIPIRANHIALRNEDGRIIGGLATISDLSLVYQLNNAIQDRYTFYDMVGKDPIMQKMFDILPIVADSDATILFEGPTGTGKDVLARVVHHSSRRAEKPMVKVNCAALPDNLLESEMFGYAKGAFTGADKDKPGRFQDADGGTLFLDEIGDMPFPLQAKLLRVLEDKEFYPLGSRKTVKVDVRIISATNQGLERMVSEKKFRQDLFYRLNVIRFELPPLSARKGDIQVLISHILKRLCLSKQCRVDKISEEAMEILLNYDYPGNVRELENILEHALIICQGNIIDIRHLPPFLGKTSAKKYNKPVEENSANYDEKQIIITTLKKHHHSKSDTAKELGMDRSTLWRKMKKYGI